MKRILNTLAVALVAFAAVSCSSKYETVDGDPMNTQIYTLENGLKVYMTVNKETPRIQTYIAVRSGGKNDPSDNTGLAHYLEHIMFKGSENFGTSDYAAEKPLLDSIEVLFDVYKKTVDPDERKAIYHVIDSLSYQASLISIPNEYDKLMALIGSNGTNAFTSNDVTCYQEEIPSNQVDAWAKIQADRFRNLVIRGFHTELEAVYEEFNMYANQDGEKAMEAVDAKLFKNHPYGKQTVIGTQEHLKNPSISAIKKQKAAYYVPNNIAICVSGDFEPDEFIATIEKYFGDWEPNPELPEFKFEPEEEITEPVSIDVYGTEAEFVMMSWRYPGESSKESEVAEIASSILSNGMCGLIDLDVMQQQKALSVSAYNYGRTDYGEMMLEGYPKDGQTLEEVRDIILEEVAKLRDGEFSDSLIAAVVNNLKLRDMRSLEQNRSRAMKYVDSFVNGTSWEDEVNKLSRMEAITKADVMDWAQKYLAANSYVAAYKHLGADPDVVKIEAPAITPIATNRDKQSAFLTEIQNLQVTPIEPVFVDYEKDMSKFTAQNLEVLYKNNDKNDIAELSFVFDEGLLSDPEYDMAFSYAEYLGTPSMSAEKIASELYALACNYNVRVNDDQITVSVSGLSENIGKALDIMADRFASAVADEDILESLKGDELAAREMSKFNQRACQQALNTYVRRGSEYVHSVTIPSAAIAGITSDELLSKVRELFGIQHKVLYYGPATAEEVQTLLAEHHAVAAELKPASCPKATKAITSEPKVIIAPYDARQFNYIQFSNRGEKFDVADDAKIDLFNEYFGGGMNTVVFQEMREARALAYSAGALLTKPYDLDDVYTFYARIGSQNDKLQIAVEAFDDIINNMPESDKSFEIAKTAMETNLRTGRVTGSRVLYNYLSSERLGLTEPREKAEFAQIGSLTLADLKATQEKWVKGRTYVYGLLGDPADLDQAYLSTLGPVSLVTLDEIFGY